LAMRHRLVRPTTHLFGSVDAGRSLNQRTRHAYDNSETDSHPDDNMA
jgi:hypothetical protein